MSIQNSEFIGAFNLTVNRLYGFLKGTLNSEREAVEILEKTYIKVFSDGAELSESALDEIVFSNAIQLCFEKIGHPKNVELDSSQAADVQKFLNACEIFDSNIGENTLNAVDALIEPVLNLDPVHRTFIYLRLYYQKNISDIAVLTECTEGTAKSVMYDSYCAVMPGIASVCRSMPALQGYPVIQLLNAALQRQSSSAFFANSEESLKRIDNVLFTEEQTNSEETNEDTEETPVQNEEENKPVEEIAAEENTTTVSEETHTYEPTQPIYRQQTVSNPVWERVSSSFAYTCIPEAKDKLVEAFGLIVTSPYEARLVFQSVAESFPTEAFSYLGLLMLDVGASDISHFYSIPANYRSILSYSNAYHFGDASIKAFLEQIVNETNYQAPSDDATSETESKKGTAIKVWGIIAAAVQAIAIAFFAYGLTQML